MPMQGPVVQHTLDVCRCDACGCAQRDLAAKLLAIDALELCDDAVEQEGLASVHACTCRSGQQRCTDRLLLGRCLGSLRVRMAHKNFYHTFLEVLLPERSTSKQYKPRTCI